MSQLRISGGEAMVRAIAANGINQVFGIPGAQIYPMFDAFARNGVELITPRHEQAAAYMAYGAAKSTGNPSAFAVVPGPGVLNTTAALVTAMGACAPVMCLTGQVPEQYLGIGRGHLHELPDQAGTLRSLIKHAFHIEKVEQTDAMMHQAFTAMMQGRHGPVSVEMCWDTMSRTMPAPAALPADVPGPVAPDDEQIEAAAQLIAKARRPMIVCGAGAQHASAEVRALAEHLGAPVTAFRSGRGVVGEDHPLGVSSLAARLLFDQVDVLIGVGSRLEMVYMRWRDMNSYEAKPAGGPRLVRIDVEADEMQRLQPDVGVVADSAEGAGLLLGALQSRNLAALERAEEVQRARFQAEALADEVQPQVAYLRAIREVLPRDGFFVGEVSQMGFASYYAWPVYQPRTYVTEGFQGTLGYGFQTALGVQAANPGRAVVSVTGDGGFMFGVQELATAAAYRLPLVTVVFNNQSFGNVRRDQQMNFDGNLAGADLYNPDFNKLADSFGIRSTCVADPDALRSALDDALNRAEPALIEVDTCKGSEASPWPYIMMANKPAVPAEG